MKGSDKVIETLNEILTVELTAVNQYYVHAKMCENWGYQRLYKHIYRKSIDGMKHADDLIGRILFLDGVPNLQRYNKVNVGENVKEQLDIDLAMGMEAVERFTKAIKLCREDERDEVSADMLEHMLTSEQEHVDWLETQLELINQVGVQNYLAQQMHGDD
jgi:bacterioferritin